MQASRLQWSGEVKALFATSGPDGIVNVYSHHDTLNPAAMKGKKASELAAPVWLHRNVGTSFGFGGKLLAFGAADRPTAMNLSARVQDQELVKAAREFDAAASQGSLEHLCAAKAQENAGSEAVSLEWRFLQALAENKKEVVLKALGFDPQTITNEAELYSGKRITGMPASTLPETANMGSLSKEEAEGFFTTLVESVPAKKEPEKDSRSRGVSMESLGAVERISRNMNWNEGVEKIIKQSILIGNLEGAVDCCLKCGRAAEALILASFAGDELFAKTKDRFLQSHKDVFLQSTFTHVISRNLASLIDGKTLHEWKETLAYCVTYSNDGGKQLAMELGNELLHKCNDADSAIICYIVANAFGPALELWSKKLVAVYAQARHRERLMLLHRTFEKVLVLRMITKSFDPSPLFDSLLIQYSLALSNNSAKELALKYLELGNPNSADVLRVKDRIIGSNPRLFKSHNRPHALPYPVIEVRVLMPAKGTSATAAHHAKEEKRNTPLYKSALSPAQPEKVMPKFPAQAERRMPPLPHLGGSGAVPEKAGIFNPGTFQPEPGAAPVQPPRVPVLRPPAPTPPVAPPTRPFSVIAPAAPMPEPAPVSRPVSGPRPIIRPPMFRPPPVRPATWAVPKAEEFHEEEKVVAPPVAPRPAATYAGAGTAPPPLAVPTFVKPVSPPPRRELLEQANFGITPLTKPKDVSRRWILTTRIGRSDRRKGRRGPAARHGQDLVRGLPDRSVLFAGDRDNRPGRGILPEITHAAAKRKEEGRHGDAGEGAVPKTGQPRPAAGSLGPGQGCDRGYRFWGSICRSDPDGEVP